MICIQCACVHLAIWIGRYNDAIELKFENGNGTEMEVEMEMKCCGENKSSIETPIQRFEGDI